MEANPHVQLTLETLLRQNLRQAEFERASQKRKKHEKFGWIDTQQTALKLNVCVKTVRNWTKAGLLPYSNTFGKTYYRIRDIKRLLKANYTQATPKPQDTPPEKAEG